MHHQRSNLTCLMSFLTHPDRPVQLSSVNYIVWIFLAQWKLWLYKIKISPAHQLRKLSMIGVQHQESKFKSCLLFRVWDISVTTIDIQMILTEWHTVYSETIMPLITLLVWYNKDQVCEFFVKQQTYRQLRDGGIKAKVVSMLCGPTKNSLNLSVDKHFFPDNNSTLLRNMYVSRLVSE